MKRPSAGTATEDCCRIKTLNKLPAVMNVVPQINPAAMGSVPSSQLTALQTITSVAATSSQVIVATIQPVSAAIEWPLSIVTTIDPARTPFCVFAHALLESDVVVVAAFVIERPPVVSSGKSVVPALNPILLFPYYNPIPGSVKPDPVRANIWLAGIPVNVATTLYSLLPLESFGAEI